MDLSQCRFVTDDVEGLARFYARLLGIAVTVNEFYVEVPAGAAAVAFSRPRFTAYRDQPSDSRTVDSSDLERAGEAILDFEVEDVDGEFPRIDAMGVAWVLLPTTQPWGNRSMIFRDPQGHLVNVFSRVGEGS